MLFSYKLGIMNMLETIDTHLLIMTGDSRTIINQILGGIKNGS